MSISYSGVVNYGKVTLPSVESWGTNNNILRDPPKSITTRRVDKVSETSIIEQEIDDSTNRASEYIRVYARGSNPMVSVSYDNFGTNSGITSGQRLLYGNQQSKLPYRVDLDGAFRPPVLREVDLLPLSRLPRNNTTIDPVAYTVDFTKKIICPGEAKDYRSVKNDTLKKSAQASSHYLIKKPTEVGVKHTITNRDINGSVQSNVRYYDNTQHSNKHTTPNIKKVNQFETTTNISRNIHNQPTDSSYTNVNQRKLNQQPFYTNIKGQNIKHIQHDIHASKRDKNVLKGEMNANIKGQNIKHVQHDIHASKRNKDVLKGEISVNKFSREIYRPQVQGQIKLQQKINLGSIDPFPTMPVIDRIAMDEKISLKKKRNNTTNLFHSKT